MKKINLIIKIIINIFIALCITLIKSYLIRHMDYLYYMRHWAFI